MSDNPTIDSVQRQPFHRVHRDFFVGLFTLLALGVVVLSLVYTVGKHEMFQDWLELHVVFESSYGLSEGDIVTISDIRVGDVRNVTLTDNGRAFVTFRVLTRHAHLVRRSSIASLRQKNILTGDWLIALSKGAPDSPMVEERDTLAGEPPMRLDKVIGQLTSMVSTFEDILDQVKLGKGLVGEMVMGDSLKGEIFRTVRDISRFTRHAQRMVVNFDSTADDFSRLSNSWTGLADTVDVLIDSIEPTIAQGNALLSQLTSSGGHLTPLLKQALVDLRDIEVLLKGLQKHWLFKRSVDKGRNNREPQESDAEVDSAQ